MSTAYWWFRFTGVLIQMFATHSDVTNWQLSDSQLILTTTAIFGEISRLVSTRTAIKVKFKVTWPQCVCVTYLGQV